MAGRAATSALQAETKHARKNRKGRRGQTGRIGGDFTPGWPADRTRNNQVDIHNQMEKRKGGGGGREGAGIKLMPTTKDCNPAERAEGIKLIPSTNPTRASQPQEEKHQVLMPPHLSQPAQNPCQNWSQEEKSDPFFKLISTTQGPVSNQTARFGGGGVGGWKAGGRFCWLGCP